MPHKGFHAHPGSDYSPPSPTARMSLEERLRHYTTQNGSFRVTPTQRRRIMQKRESAE